MSNLKTVSFDPAVYRLVPVEATCEIVHDLHYFREGECGMAYLPFWMHLLSTVPDALPGVIENDGCEPAHPDKWLMAIQCLCVAANQEYSRCSGALPEWDQGFFLGQLHIFNSYTSADKSAIAEAREYLSKLTATSQPESEALPGVGEHSGEPMAIGFITTGEVEYKPDPLNRLMSSMDELRRVLQAGTPSIDTIHEFGPDGPAEAAWQILHDDILPFLTHPPAPANAIDAERYAWLRDKANYAPSAAPMVFLTARGIDINWDDALIGAELDDAIDAAMKAAK
jgi:hypothetical protein